MCSCLWIWEQRHILGEQKFFIWLVINSMWHICIYWLWLLHNLFTVIFEKKHLVGYLRKLLYYCGVIFVSCIATCFICSKINVGLIATLIIRGLICVILPNLIYLLAYYKRIEFTDSLLLVDKMTKGKLRGFLTKLGMKE